MKTKTIKLYHLTIFSTLVLAMLGALIFSSISTPKSSALDGSDFDPGRIIDDAVFKNEKAMSVSQIQQFLNSKMPDCDTDGSEPYAGTTRAAYGASRGYPAPYTCLKDYTQTVPATSSSSSYCTSSMTGGTKTAAQIIHDVGHACDINPQVLIVMLQKEQGLVTDEWPWSIQYRSAMGYGCPDTAPCDEEYYGFFNQVYQGANAYLRYAANPSWYSYRAGRTNTIYWHPDLSRCGSSNVFIENQSTAGLYIYTPYRPNSSALNNLYTTGNSCSSYGNRNFWRYFNDWFGSTKTSNSYEQMKTPRWMKIRSDVRKISLTTGEDVGDLLTENTEIYFKDKINIGGQLYLRTKYDTDSYNNYVIPIDNIEDINITYQQMKTPRWMKTTKELQKIDPLTREKVGEVIPKGTEIFFPEKVIVGGSVYLRTEADSYNGGIQTAINIAFLENKDVSYVPLEEPRWFVSTLDTMSYNLKYTTDTPNSQFIPKNDKVYYDNKVFLNGSWRLTSGLPAPGSWVGTPLNHLRELGSNDFISLKYHRAYRVEDSNVSKSEFYVNYDPAITTLNQGEDIFFETKLILGNKTYLRSSHDTSEELLYGIDINSLSPVNVDFEKMLSPRKLMTTKLLRKRDPVTLHRVSKYIDKGTEIMFVDKISINGKLYLRTEHDSGNGHYRVIDITHLEEL